MSSWLSQRFSRLLAGALLMGVAFWAGCGSSGPPLAPVVGTVLLDGAPVEGLLVEFQPIEPGRPSMAHTDKNGKFNLRFTRNRWGAMPGEHRVLVSYERDPDSDKPPLSVKIPKKYNDETELRHNVIQGKNKVELSLVSEPVNTANTKRKFRR